MTEAGCGVEALQLKDQDFPNNYVSFAHPDDYKLVKGAFPAPEYIYNERLGQHQRLIIRMPIAVDENEYFIASFVVDTGAPTSFYLCNRFIDILTSRGRCIVDQELDTNFFQTKQRKFRFEATPPNHAPANIIGLRACMYLGLRLDNALAGKFTFENYQPMVLESLPADMINK